jgi:hypothetical protein
VPGGRHSGAAAAGYDTAGGEAEAAGELVLQRVGGGRDGHGGRRPGGGGGGGGRREQAAQAEDEWAAGRVRHRAVQTAW